jgi:hypothetical protein
LDDPSALDVYAIVIADPLRGLPLWQFVEIGCGGSHRVYQHQRGTPFVIKLPHAAVQSAGEEPPGFHPAGWSPDHEVAYLTTGHDRLMRYFGRDWCIPQHAVLTTVQLAPHADPIHTYAIVQPYEPAFRHLELVRIDTPYLELQLDDPAMDQQRYHRMNAALLGAATPEVTAYATLNPVMQPCLDHIAHDALFLDLIQRFLMTFKRYVEETDEIIDLVGEYNVFAAPTPAGWTLRIGSVLKGQRHADWLAALVQLRAANGQGAHLALPYRSILLNGLAVYRLVNALAIQAIGRRLLELRLDDAQLAAISTVRHLYPAA